MEQSPSPPLKFGWAIKGRQGKLVQKMKAHASEYAQHPALCGQVINKKMHRAARVQISTSESGLCTSMYVSTLEIAGNGPKRSNGPSPQGYTSSCKFFTFYASIWPLFPSFNRIFLLEIKHMNRPLQNSIF
jgi:hypothetical protein